MAKLKYAPELPVESLG